MPSILERASQGVTRRYFLKAGAAAGGGLMIGWVDLAAADPGIDTKAEGDFAPNQFIIINRQETDAFPFRAESRAIEERSQCISRPVKI